jgi:tyrosine-protein kinase Etk/Wzc
MTENNKNFFKVNDDIDLISIFFVTLKNLNLFISVFLTSFLISFVYYLSSTKIYKSDSLIEIQKQDFANTASAFNPMSLTNNSLEAEMEIYKSRNTLEEVISRFSKEFPEDNPPKFSALFNGLSLSARNNSLVQISFSYDDEKHTRTILDMTTEEFINSKTNFKKESTAATRKFISEELPKVKILLSEAEDNLNNFKLSTNSSDIIFDDQTRNKKLNELQERINEINFKELELKEFYKANHPIYLTLSEQKKLVMNLIQSIEKDLPKVPDRQRKIENLKREVKIYSDVIQNLTSQEINLSLKEASSTSNVRVINKAKIPEKISPLLIVIPIFPITIFLITFLIQTLRYFLDNRITNLDALSDFIGKDRVIGELPLLKDDEKENDKRSIEMADELLQKTIYEITHSDKDFSSMMFTSSKKDVGKTEISKKIFDLLVKEGKRVCFLDLDFRQGSLSKKTFDSDKTLKSFEDFFQIEEEFRSENSLFIPSFSVDSIPTFFKSSEFESNIDKLKKDYDYVICDTPPWPLFVDAKIISKHFSQLIYIVGSEISTFKDIEIFESDTNRYDSISYFFNKFNYFYNFFGYQYQYPYYSNNYYYDYENYRSLKKEANMTDFFKKILNFFKKRLKK